MNSCRLFLCNKVIFEPCPKFLNFLSVMANYPFVSDPKKTSTVLTLIQSSMKTASLSIKSSAGACVGHLSSTIKFF